MHILRKDVGKTLRCPQKLCALHRVLLQAQHVRVPPAAAQISTKLANLLNSERDKSTQGQMPDTQTADPSVRGPLRKSVSSPDNPRPVLSRFVRFTRFFSPSLYASTHTQTHTHTYTHTLLPSLLTLVGVTLPPEIRAASWPLSFWLGPPPPIKAQRPVGCFYALTRAQRSARSLRRLRTVTRTRRAHTAA